MLKQMMIVALLGAGLASLMAGTALAEPSTRAATDLDVVMYTTQSCSYCVKARSYFTSHDVAWQERDIETSQKAHAEWKSLGGVGTPLIVIEGERFQGFDQRRLDTALAKHGK